MKTQKEVDEILKSERSPMEKAIALELDTSSYIERDQAWWCPAFAAELVIKAVNPDKEVKAAYVKNAYSNQHVRRILIIAPNRYAYELAGLLKVKVQSRGKPLGAQTRPHKPHQMSAEGSQRISDAQKRRRIQERQKAEPFKTP